MSGIVEEVDAAAHAIFTGMPLSFSQAFDAGLPSVTRPFGVALWPIFRWVVFKLAHYDVESFNYEYNSTVPMSRVPDVSLAIVAYYIVIFGGRWLLKNVRPIRLNPLFKLHNLLLTLLSLGLLILLVEQMLPIIVQHGVFYSICSTGSWTQRVEFIYYLNYLTKYYELLDTVFMVLRKRPLTFLHTYHHGATALLCFTQLNGRTSVSYVPITLNLAVHVLMYFYYLLAACGIRPWWKTWVTRFQIIQFIIDLGFIYFATYTHFVNVLHIDLPNMGRCSGDEAAAVNGCLIISSYLVLFVSFYIKSYIVPAAAKKAAKEQQLKASQESGVAAAASVNEGPASPKEPVPSTSSTRSSQASPRKRTTRSRRA